MSLEQDIALLRAVPIFDVLSADALRALAASAEHKRLEPGHVLFRSGSLADAGYVVVSGGIDLISREGDGRRVVKSVGPGALVGARALLVELPRPFDAVVAGSAPAEVLRLSRVAFVQMLEDFPDAALRLRDIVGARVDRLLTELNRVRATLERGLG